ncbi:MAG TPA: 50S ribosomal protein L3 [Candidatus Saccharimonadales bacterium]|nr:50S ribosomal protein L3 [Candidatus Saccharimonadales bacterium]
MKALVTRKLGMSSIISDNGAVEAVTYLVAAPNTVTQVKTIEKDGYLSVQLGAFEKKKLSKPETGHLKNAEKLVSVLREFKIPEGEDNIETTGQQVSAGSFAVGDLIDAVGTSKGKGFAGTIKRHNFHRGRKTHGGRSYRRPGSIGSMYPQKVFKGKKMSGQMGAERVTVKNLKISVVDDEKGLIGVAGAIPGPKRSIVLIKGVK